MTENILAETTVTEDGRRLKFTVYGGLHYIKGNSAPHFSLTYWCGGSNTGHGGAGHEEILSRFPEFADLAALHLSDMNGQPMHAEANGWYWLEGCFGGLGSDYHGASGKYGKTPDECEKIFRSHMRFTESQWLEAWIDLCSLRNTGREIGQTDQKILLALKARFAEIVAGQRQRWQVEAQACIAKHNLTVYGDDWEAA
jgi:hypothetical protein